MNDLDTARAMAAGDLPSPTPFGNFMLWAIRVTGTGRAERTARAEIVYRDPNIWLNPETLARCSGLPVLVEHPESGTLDSDEFGDRSVGNVLFPYLADAKGIQNDNDPNNLGPDIWAVIRCYDDATNKMLQERTLSTSPAVAFKPSDGNTTVPTAAGHILFEGMPSLIDHIALVMDGVWDRDGGPSGVRNDNLKTRNDAMAEKTETEQSGVTEAPKEGFPGELLDKLLTTLDGMSKRLDAMELADKARRDAASQDPKDDPHTEEEKRRGATPEMVADGADYAARQELERQDAADKAQAQARADAVYQDLGSRAPAPMAGETLQGYRTRMARGLQRHSAGFNKVDLGGIQGSAFAAIEDRIYADAATAARTPEIIPGVLRELTKTDAHTGQRITTFHGDQTFIHMMKRPSRRLIGINTKFPD